jgi:hypothetical protein
MENAKLPCLCHMKQCDTSPSMKRGEALRRDILIYLLSHPCISYIHRFHKTSIKHPSWNLQFPPKLFIANCVRMQKAMREINPSIQQQITCLSRRTLIKAAVCDAWKIIVFTGNWSLAKEFFPKHEHGRFEYFDIIIIDFYVDLTK